MSEANNADLMREYTSRDSESAFAELVQRHINLVYSVALRYVGHSEDARDVTQTVFIILAQKAASLRQSTILTGWLYETTRFTAMKLLRTKARQQAREQEAYMQSTLNDSNTDSVWRQLAPLLEEAMTRLSEKDRTLLALRFFENKSGAETAAILGIQEWAAHKRVNRAVEKLRMFFAKRGVVLPAAALTAAISANAVQAAPVGLAVTISTAAVLTGTTIAATATATAIKTIAMTTLQKTLVTATVAVLAGAGIYQARKASSLGREVQTLQQQQAPLTDEVAQLKAENERLSNLVGRAGTSPVVTKTPPLELLRLRGEVGRLREDSKELAQTKSMQALANDTSERAEMLKQLLRSAKTAASVKESQLAQELKLDFEQFKSLSNILSNKVRLQNQLLSARWNGDISYSEMQKQLRQTAADAEQGIVAMLDTNQQATYEQMNRKDDAVGVKFFAEAESASMKRMFDLTQEQTDAVAAALAKLPSMRGGSDLEGGMPDAVQSKQQFETVILALQPVLSAEQLQTYRQSRLKQIDEITQYREKQWGRPSR
jgi:RNA polymerase sigma factor (sigma-70 family)